MLTVGVIVGTHGIGGDLKVRPVTDQPEQFDRLRHVVIGSEPVARRVQRVRFHAGNVLMKVRGIDDPETGQRLRGEPVRISGRDAIPPAEGEYLLYQLIGLDAFDESGLELGTTVDLIETGSRDVFVIRPVDGGAEILLPNVEDVILEIVPAERRMVVRLPEYL